MAPVLGYWKLRGLAQPIKLLLAHVGQDYEDKQYIIGPAPKYDLGQWLDDKFTLGLDFPNLPYYIDGNTKITQSMAILQYLGRKNNLVGNTEQEIISIDMLIGLWNDMKSSFSKMCYSPDYTVSKEEVMTGITTKLKDVSKYLGSHPWLAGEKLTFIDFLYFEFFDVLRHFEPSIFDEFSNFKGYLERFAALPNVAKYLASSECIKNEVNGPMASWNGF